MASTSSASPPVVCSVCTENFNLSSRKSVECPGCTFSGCTSCYKTYFKTTAVTKCMNCPIEFSLKFLYDHFTKSFIMNDLRDMKREALYQAERSRLGENMYEAGLVQQQRRIIKEKENIHKRWNQIITQEEREMNIRDNLIPNENETFDNNDGGDVNDIFTNPTYLQKVELYTRHAGLYYQQKFLADALTQIEHRLYRCRTRGNTSSIASQSEKVKMVVKCPGVDCDGIVIGGTWRCGKCTRRVCAQCHKFRKDNENDNDVDVEGGGNNQHVCDPNEVETVKMLKADTKPCPKCGIPIVKAFGCDQMWATCCNVAFNWRTGQPIENLSHFHNPEFTQYLQNNHLVRPRPDNQGNEREEGRQCGMPSMAETMSWTRTYIPLNLGFESIEVNRDYNPKDTSSITKRSFRQVFCDLFNYILDRRDEHFQRYGQEVADAVNNSDYRVKLLTGDITEDQFKKTILARFIRNEKIDAFYEIRAIFRLGTDNLCRSALIQTKPIASEDSYQRKQQEKQFVADLAVALSNIEKFCDEIAKEFKAIAKMHNSFQTFINVEKVRLMVYPLQTALTNYQERYCKDVVDSPQPTPPSQRIKKKRREPTTNTITS